MIQIEAVRLLDEMEDAVAVIDGSRCQRLAFLGIHVFQAKTESTIGGEGANMAIKITEVAIGVVGDAIAAVAIRIASL